MTPAYWPTLITLSSLAVIGFAVWAVVDAFRKVRL